MSIACAKVLGQGHAWHVGGRTRPAWLDQSEPGGEKKVRAGREWRQEVQGLVDSGEDLDFYPEGGGRPEGLYADKGWM